jgi:hypothetical protein
MPENEDARLRAIALRALPETRYKVEAGRMESTRPLCSVVEVKVSGKKSCMMPPPARS